MVHASWKSLTPGVPLVSVLGEGHRQEVTVVIYSGSTSPLDRHRAEESKVNGYLVKPMTGDEMDAIIMKLRQVLLSIVNAC